MKTKKPRVEEVSEHYLINRICNRFENAKADADVGHMYAHNGDWTIVKASAKSMRNHAGQILNELARKKRRKVK